MNLIFLGLPGCGKGTQAQFLAEKRGKRVVIAGDLLRKEVERKSEVGTAIGKALSEGKLVPDEVVINLVEQSIEGMPRTMGLVFDGYPRTVGQAKALDQYFQKRGELLPRVIFFNISVEKLTDRLLGRITCAKCGAVYNQVYLFPKTPGRCDHCGEKLLRRADDDLATIQKRIEVYYEQTEPLKQAYAQEGRLIKIRADLSPETVYQELCEQVGLDPVHDTK